MVLAKSKTSVGLGNLLMNDRFGKGKGSDRRRGGAITRTNHATGETYVTNDRAQASWVKMRSITEQGALDEFLATAELAGTDFTAQKMNNVKIIHTDQRNPYLLTPAEERATLSRHRENRNRLTVPRRPVWDATTTPAELDVRERESFLIWRRGLAELQDNQDLLMTPFERNIEVWRQLWRVIERSDLVVQIVDARNPLLFRSADLVDYVHEVNNNEEGSRKQNLLLINKADMMTDRQRLAWARHLTSAKITYKFFSAHLAKEQNELRDLAAEEGTRGEEETGATRPSQSISEGGNDADAKDSAAADSRGEVNEDEDEKSRGSPGSNDDEIRDEDLDTRILTVEELESLFLQMAPRSADPERKLQVGLVGYPNVGKSSTINALIGAKKVSVSSTPGKTKHFQTIHLSESVVLCDCPGLVFPNFATTKGDLVCNGILPIDQMREFSGPAGLVAARIPKAFLEAIYGIQIRTRPLEEGGTGVPTGEELMMAYARARGFTKTGLGQPDEARAARYILKDYVNGKLLYVAPPPDAEIDPLDFNHELYDMAHLPEKQQRKLAARRRVVHAQEDPNSDSNKEDSDDAEDAGPDADGDAISLAPTVDTPALPHPGGPKTQSLDRAFFDAERKKLAQLRQKQQHRGNGGHLAMPFSHKYSEQGRAATAAAAASSAASLASSVTGSQRQLSGRKARTMMALENGLDPEEVREAMAAAGGSKKHYKGGAKGKGKKKTPANATDD